MSKRNLGVVYTAANEVQVKDIGYPKFEDPQGKPAQHGVIVKCIATNVCGSDLHMYRGRTSAKPGTVFGHEITGEVVEIGTDVLNIVIGDIVSVPFNISCGRCNNCRKQLTNICLTVNPAQPGGAYGYADMGGWIGGQAEYVLVPYADFQCLVLPKDKAMNKMKDLAMLSDILPTGFNAAIQAGVSVGKTVYVAGAGPVGICCAASCFLLGAAVVIVGDLIPERLALAASLGCKTIDLSKVQSSADAVSEEIAKILGKKEVDASCDCVGYEACGLGKDGRYSNETEGVLNTCFHVTKAGGRVGIPGLYLPADPHGKTEELKQGIIPIKFGLAWSKAIGLGTGQCPVMAYHRELMMAILYDRIKLSDALNVQVINFDQVPEAYRLFNSGKAVKYILDPHGLMN